MAEDEKGIIRGERGRDGLTRGERQLLASCRAQGIAIVEGFLHHAPTNTQYWHARKGILQALTMQAMTPEAACSGTADGLRAAALMVAEGL